MFLLVLFLFFFVLECSFFFFPGWMALTFALVLEIIELFAVGLMSRLQSLIHYNHLLTSAKQKRLINAIGASGGNESRRIGRFGGSNRT